MRKKLKPKISIITVCYNSANVLEETMKSVFSQDYTDIEYIVIDGASTDGSQKIFQKYMKKIDLFISEPDNGVYDAMNKGIKRATGDFIHFLNAGDTFHARSTITHMSHHFEKNTIVYGDNIITSKDYTKRIKYPAKLSSLYLTFFSLNHQTFFTPRGAFEKVGIFKLDYPVHSFLDWEIRCFKQYNMKHVSVIVCQYDEGGLSSNIRWNEKDAIVKNHFPLNFILYKIAMFIYRFLRKTFGISVARLVRKIFYK